jgi:predicted permease
VGRLAPGATLAAARAELDAAADRLRETFPDTHRDRAFVALPSTEVRILPGIDPLLYPAGLVALAVVGLSLLIANFNLAQLLLVRGLERRREIAIRLSLGARRALLVRQLLAEGLVLSSLGGVLGLVLAAATPLALLWLPALPVDVALGLAVDWRVVLFTLTLPTLTTLAFATAPALDATRPDLSLALRQGGLTGVMGRRRIRQGLVAAQLALAFVALFAAGAALAGLAAALAVDPGFASRGAAVASLAPRLQGYGPERTRTLYRGLLDELRRQPETLAAGLASHLPLSVELLYERVAVPGSETPESEWPLVDTALVGPGYLEAIGTPILRGRSFEASAGAEAGRVAVVNEALAARLWPGEEAVGQRLRLAGPGAALEVIGVVATGRYRSLVEAPRPFLFQALPDSPRPGRTGEVSLGTRTLVVRARGGEAAAREAIRRALRRLAPDLAPVRLTSLAEATSLPGLLPRAFASVFGSAAGVALLLVAFGVAGVAAYSASRRRREIGVRLALGARPADIRRLLLREALEVVAAGTALGAALSAAGADALAGLLLGGDPIPPAVWLAAAVVLAALVAGASLAPAARAARAHPQACLRDE